VVFNHLGPDGNYLSRFGPYLGGRASDWGEGIDFGAPGVRELCTTCAARWIREYHLDGLRLDAVHAIHDASPEHIVDAVAGAARAAAGARRVLVFAEDDERRPWPRLDGVWNDDFHHAAHVALTGRRDGYYDPFAGTIEEMADHLDTRRRRVNYLMNHDQIAASARGERLPEITDPARLRALTALLLLAPGTPLLFMGQEWAASTPWLFFADHHPELAAQVRKGRAAFLARFASLADPAVQARLDDPGDPATFARCRLERDERGRGRHAEWMALHRDLLDLRRRTGDDADLEVIGADALAMRLSGHLLVVNLGTDRVAPAGAVILSTEDPRYGGGGTPAGVVPGHAAVLYSS
jgi:maltooligosyltrehalose trehalohydrolase